MNILLPYYYIYCSQQKLINCQLIAITNKLKINYCIDSLQLIANYWRAQLIVTHHCLLHPTKLQVLQKLFIYLSDKIYFIVHYRYQFLNFFLLFHFIESDLTLDYEPQSQSQCCHSKINQ
jgi:hypothetical protein